MSRRSLVGAFVLVGLLVVLTFGVSGCSSGENLGVAASANAEACGGDKCHGANVTVMAAGRHGGLACSACHEGAGEEHAADPEAVLAGIDWRIDACSGCHEGEAVTYLYDDNAKAGPFGGSVREPAQPKTGTFPEYNTIVAGHGFTKEYNEEGAHAFMLEDHYEITRGKFETCMQCKSTKVASAWNSGKALTVEEDVEITLTHTKTETEPAKKVKVPAGTKVAYATDPETHEVDAKATFPDGTVFSSRPKESEDATANFNTMWAVTVAVTNETRPYGAGCNHCHDPHSGELRLVRKALISAIEGDEDSHLPTGGVNPYTETPVKDFDSALAQDQRILTCAQCHVEYTCGKSGVDGLDRDAYGWSKAKDLHGRYMVQFDYTQDWKNAIMGQPLIKSQHPETELYWNSVHYQAGASCGDCHMLDVRFGNERIKSHWFTSPYKYQDAELVSKFALETGVSRVSVYNPCTRCHLDRSGIAIEQQKQFFAQQAKVEKLLAQSVRAMGAVPAAKREGVAYVTALEAHREAHVIWENLAVSENSMGFHNFEESMSSMRQAEKRIGLAIATEKELAPK
jgi:formate-dependent nitrite reductase cytochrome c552 subunit